MGNNKEIDFWWQTEIYAVRNKVDQVDREPACPKDYHLIKIKITTWKRWPAEKNQSITQKH